jgi:dienelactone hydrolase
MVFLRHDESALHGHSGTPDCVLKDNLKGFNMYNRHTPTYLALPLFATLSVSMAGTAVAQPQGAEETNRRPDNVGTGAYPAIKEEVAELPGHVIYRPADLAALGAQKLGVVAWGNGGCSPDGASSRFHLLELASHGYLVIAAGTILSGPGAPPREPPVEGQQGLRTVAADLTAALDWAFAENERQGSPYYGRLDPEQVAASGVSCGGLQAIEVAGDPRIDTLVLQNTGILNDGPNALMPGMSLVKDDLKAIHTPTIYILGGDSDIAYVNGMDDFKRIEHVPVAVANLLGAGHGGTYSHDNGGVAAQVAVHWLNWQLRDDAESAKYFVGADCILCTDPAWSFEAKQLVP